MVVHMSTYATLYGTADRLVALGNHGFDRTAAAERGILPAEQAQVESYRR